MSETITVNGVNYRQRMTTCKGSGGMTKDGKVKYCRKCEEGGGHGPYWYANGTRYVGKELPAWIIEHLALLEAERGNLEKIMDGIRKRSEYHLKQHRQAEDELRAVEALIEGQWVDQRVLKTLQLEKFSVNGHK